MADWLQLSVFGVTQFFMLIGLFGSVFPVFPGIFIMWLAALGYGIVTKFNTLGLVVFIIMTLLMIAAGVVDNLLMAAGTRKGGTAWGTVAVAVIAGVVGTILFPPLGGLIAAPLAVLLLEYYRLRDLQLAMAALRGLATGRGLSFIARFGIGLAMMVLWWFWVWAG
jgi:hypothetical protein